MIYRNVLTQSMIMSYPRNPTDLTNPDYSELRSLENPLVSHTNYREEAEIPALRNRRSVTFQQQLLSTVPAQFLEKPKTPTPTPTRRVAETLKKAAEQSEADFLEEVRRREDLERAEIAAIADALIESRALVPDREYDPTDHPHPQSQPHPHVPPTLHPRSPEFVADEDEEQRLVDAAIAASLKEQELERRRDEERFLLTMQEALEISKVQEEEDVAEIVKKFQDLEDADQAYPGGSSSSTGPQGVVKPRF